MATGTALVGYNTKVTLGTDKILGMGNWTMSGVTTDLLESTEFGTEWKSYELGLKDGGEVSFNGFYDKSDTTGQNALRTANTDATKLTDLRFYVDETSYYVPSTTDPVSYAIVTSYDISADMGELVNTSFSCKVSGKMVLM